MVLSLGVHFYKTYFCIVLVCMMMILNSFHKNNTSFFHLVVISLMFFTSCKSLPQNTTTTVKRYAVGQGGGFTGAYTEFSFSDDGKVYKRDFNYERDVFVKQLSESDLKYFLNQIMELGLATFELNVPGNMSKYIEIRDGETSQNKIVWGANNYNPPQKIVDFHQELYKKLSALE
jgi:hypothetical protein